MEQIHQAQRRSNLVGVPYSVPVGTSGDKLVTAQGAMVKQLGFGAVIFGISLPRKPYFWSLFYSNKT